MLIPTLYSSLIRSLLCPVLRRFDSRNRTWLEDEPFPGHATRPLSAHAKVGGRLDKITGSTWEGVEGMGKRRPAGPAHTKYVRTPLFPQLPRADDQKSAGLHHAIVYINNTNPLRLHVYVLDLRRPAPLQHEGAGYISRTSGARVLTPLVGGRA